MENNEQNNNVENKELDTKTENTEINESQTEAEKAPEQSVEDKLKQQLMHTMADFENYKRREAKDRARWSQITQAKVLKAFLPLIDDIGLALDVANASELADADREWLAGFSIVQSKLSDIFGSQQVTEIDCSGSFDPNVHEALMSVESDDLESDAIVEVLRKGYTLNETVLRHAQVSVAK